MEDESCKTCACRTELIMWEDDEKGRYLPNYDNPLWCCTAIPGVVFGHTDPSHNSLCECDIHKVEEQEHD